MKKFLIVFGLFLSVFGCANAAKIDKIDPACWFVGMKNPELQLLVYGQGIGNSTFSVDYPGVTVREVVSLDSKNYLMVYLNLDKSVKPGTMKLVFKNGNKKTVYEYELRARSKTGSEHVGFDASDVLYMLMPDRFANGNPANDQIRGMMPYKVNRAASSLRHGGDLAGIEQHLNYFTQLGVTALWFTPVLENNTPDDTKYNSSTYHGYETTDYYKVDPRLGTNEEYCHLIDKAHERGLKIVMDMIFNHCSSSHIWYKDPPMKDWFNYVDPDKKYTQTTYKLTPQIDPYASQIDEKESVDGWFVRSMPDLNQRNPYLKRYLIQNSIWWIEYAGIDGIRMDTYPYADFDMMAQWCQEVNEEYPNFNIVGETWVTEPAYTATWQKDSKLAKKNSYLKTVMDFSFYDKINQAMHEDTDGWWHGLNRIYNNFVYDYLYPDPLHIMAFLENHDTDRFLKDSQNSTLLKQAFTLLLTTRRIPQLYYGTEIMMNGTKNKTDGDVRKDFPGGWKEDAQNAFTSEGRTAIQNDMFDFVSKLLHWRKGNDVISKGSMTQFIPFNGVYVYSRSYVGKSVMVILNGTDSAVDMPVARYAEVLPKSIRQGKDVITGKIIDLNGETIHLQPRESFVVDFDK